MYSNNIVNFQESMTILNACTRKSGNLLKELYIYVSVIVKAMDCGIVVSEFDFQSHYYVHFQTNTLGRGMNPLILPAMS